MTEPKTTRDAPRYANYARKMVTRKYATSEAEHRARQAEIPEDTRSLTARILGDPIPNDPRRQT